GPPRRGRRRGRALRRPPPSLHARPDRRRARAWPGRLAPRTPGRRAPEPTPSPRRLPLPRPLPEGRGDVPARRPGAVRGAARALRALSLPRAMIVERTQYYAHPGRAEDVLATRRKASEIRSRLGLPRGVISVGAGHEDGGPDVAWECAFPTPEAHQEDLQVRAASPEVRAVRVEMGALRARFERHVWRTDDAAAPAGTAEADPRADAAPLVGRPIVPRVVRFPAGALELTGYLYTPPGAGPFPCLVTNHGSSIHQGTSDVCRPGMADLLMRWGYASLLPHRPGYGNSPGPGWRREVTAEFGTPEYDTQLVRRLESESLDVVAALDGLAGYPDIDPRRVGVMGSSFGGVVSLLAAARTDRFACAVDFAGA